MRVRRLPGCAVARYPRCSELRRSHRLEHHPSPPPRQPRARRRHHRHPRRESTRSTPRASPRVGRMDLPQHPRSHRTQQKVRPAVVLHQRCRWMGETVKGYAFLPEDSRGTHAQKQTTESSRSSASDSPEQGTSTQIGSSSSFFMLVFRVLSAPAAGLVSAEVNSKSSALVWFAYRVPSKRASTSNVT